MSPDPALSDAIGHCLGAPGARVLEVESRPLGAGFADAMAGGDGLLLHEGAARTPRGVETFELVEKICPVLPGGLSADSWIYWKREALAYRSGLLSEIDAGIRAPRCYGVTLTRAPSARIFMEAIGGTQPDWTARTHAHVARQLGRFNATRSRRAESGRHPWLAPGRAHGWTAIAADTMDRLESLRGDPVLSRWLAGPNLARTRALWRQLRVVTDGLAELPACLCHHDAFRRNILFRGGAEDGEIVAIDWAFMGPGVLGEELAAAIGAALMFRDIDRAQAQEMSEILFAGYLDGLRDAGQTVSRTDVRLGYTATTAMMFALGAVGVWLPLLRDPAMDPVLRAITGTDREEFLDHLGATHGFFLDLGEEAVSLAGGG